MAESLDRLKNELRRINETTADEEPTGTHWTRKGANLGVAAAVEVQRATGNPVLVAAASLLGSIGAFVGSLRDNKELSVSCSEAWMDEEMRRY